MIGNDKNKEQAMWPSFETASRIVDVANIFLIGSLVVGVITTVLIVWMGNKKEEYLTRELAARGADAAYANLQIAALEKQSRVLEESTAKANERAAQAQLDLAKFKAPRNLSPATQASMSASLKRFSGTQFDIGVGPKGDPEPIVFARTLYPALVSAGWLQIPWTGGGETYGEPADPEMKPIGLTSVTNIIVDVHPSQWAKLGPAAQALASALTRAGVDAQAQSQPTTIPGDVIHIRIGRKLQG